MTKFADEQKAKQVQAELEDQSLDYFDVLSDSPLVDAEESERLAVTMFIGRDIDGRLLGGLDVEATRSAMYGGAIAEMNVP
jgi:hypothetical protein